MSETQPSRPDEVEMEGTPVWSHDGIICTGESDKSFMKLTFAKGASLQDPANLFNSSLEGNYAGQSTSKRLRSTLLASRKLRRKRRRKNPFRRICSLYKLLGF